MRSGARVADRGLKLVTAVIARPEMPNVAFVDVLAPFRSEQRVAALRAGDDRARSMQGGYIPGSDVHDVSCLCSLSPPTD